MQTELKFYDVPIDKIIGMSAIADEVSIWPAHYEYICYVTVELTFDKVEMTFQSEFVLESRVEEFKLNYTNLIDRRKNHAK